MLKKRCLLLLQVIKELHLILAVVAILMNIHTHIHIQMAALAEVVTHTTAPAATNLLSFTHKI
jgi:hypothetical protein